jgi:hypothetical protein
VPSFAERRAQRVFRAAVDATPPGAARPWRTARNLDAIKKMLADGIAEGDLVTYVQGCAELVRRHRELPRWWSIANLLGERTLDVWRAKLAEMLEDDRRREANEAAVEQVNAEHAREVASAPTPQVENLALARLYREAAAAWHDRDDDRGWSESDG